MAKCQKWVKMGLRLSNASFYRDLPIAAIASMKHSKHISPKTVNKYMSWYSTLFRWALKHGYTKTNPSEGLLVKCYSRPDEERLPYDLEDLICLADSPLFNTAHPDYEEFGKKGDSYYWIPLVSLYSGCRLGEVCQLHTDDVQERNGINYFDINNKADKQLKTLRARRVVPIHSALLKLGFLEYVILKKESGNVSLWPCIKTKCSKLSHLFSNFWQRYGRKYIT